MAIPAASARYTISHHFSTDCLRVNTQVHTAPNTKPIFFLIRVFLSSSMQDTTHYDTMTLHDFYEQGMIS